MYDKNLEIRHISTTDIINLAEILEPTQGWKKLMRIIPKSLDTTVIESICKYNNDHIKLIENACYKQNRTATEILLEEWSTSGKRRPRLKDLLKFLVKAELFRAADFVAVNFLKEPVPDRPLHGPAAKIDINIPIFSNELREISEIIDGVSYPSTQNLVNGVNEISNLNNHDYFTKLEHNKNNILNDISKFREKIDESSVIIPKLSELVSNTFLHENNVKHIELTTNSVNQMQYVNYNKSLGDIGELPNLSAIGLINNQELIFDESLNNARDKSDKIITKPDQYTEETISSSSENQTEYSIPCISALHKE